MSKLEEALLAQIAAAGLPAPKTEFRFCDRLWRFDLCWDLYKIAVEINGGTRTRPVQMKGGWWQRVSGHNSTLGIRTDYEKKFEAECAGWWVVCVDAGMVEDRTALAMVSRAMAIAKARRGFPAAESTETG